VIRIVDLAVKRAPLAGVTLDVSGVVAVVGDGGVALFDALDGTVRRTRGRVDGAGRVFRVSLEAPLPEPLTVAETCALARRLRHEPARPAEDVLAGLGIASLAPRRVASLTREERRTVTFAIALASEADLLLVEEPLVGLAPEAPRHVAPALRARAAAIVTTSSLADAHALADRTLRLSNGSLVPVEAPVVRAVLLRVPPEATPAVVAAFAREIDIRTVSASPGEVMVSGDDTVARVVTRVVAALGVSVFRIEGRAG